MTALTGQYVLEGELDVTCIQSRRLDEREIVLAWMDRSVSDWPAKLIICNTYSRIASPHP